MKNVLSILATMLIVASCGAPKQITESPKDVTNHDATNSAGEKIIESERIVSDFDYAKGLSEDGTKIVEIPYRWWSGTFESEIEQVAIEYSQRDAYNTVSRVISNAVKQSVDDCQLVVNQKVQNAIVSSWEQHSISFQKECSPWGTVKIQYNPTTKLYKAISKVAVPGPKYIEFINNGDKLPVPSNSELSEEEQKQFINANKEIFKAVKNQLNNPMTE